MRLLPTFLRRRRGETGEAMQGELIKHANQLSPDMPLKSIIQRAKLSPAEKVKITLKLLRGETVAAMCESLGRGVQHVSVVINGKRESATLKQEIAAYLGGLEVEDIFPSNHKPSLSADTTADQREV